MVAADTAEVDIAAATSEGMLTLDATASVRTRGHAVLRDIHRSVQFEYSTIGTGLLANLTSSRMVCFSEAT